MPRGGGRHGRGGGGMRGPPLFDSPPLMQHPPPHMGSGGHPPGLMDTPPGGYYRGDFPPPHPGGGRGRGSGGKRRNRGGSNGSGPPAKKPAPQEQSADHQESPAATAEDNTPDNPPSSSKAQTSGQSSSQDTSAEAPQNTSTSEIEGHNLEDILKEKKFSYKARLFVANVAGIDLTTFKGLFSPYGEIRDVHLNKEKGFGFLKLAYRYLAEKAKDEVDGTSVNGKRILVRFPEVNDAIEVQNLSDSVTDELLAEAFCTFGAVEEAIVATDNRARSLGYGVVRFASRQSAQHAISACSEGHFLLTSKLKPVIVREYVQKNEEDGLKDKAVMNMRWAQRERSQQPRFATRGSYEEVACQKWKQLLESQEVRKRELEKTFREEKVALEKEVDSQRGSVEAEIYRLELQRQKEETIRMLDQIQQQERLLNTRAPAPGAIGGGLMMPPQLMSTPPLPAQPLLPMEGHPPVQRR